MLSKIKSFNNYFSNNFFHLSAVILLSIFPLFFFLGTGVLNMGIIVLDIIFITEIFKNKKLTFLKNYIFYSLILLWLTFLVNIFFSIDPMNSLGRGFGFIRFIFFIMLIIYYFNINNNKFQKIILHSWLVIFLFTNIDLVFEFFRGKNILGFVSNMPGRLTGFFHDELIIGHFYYAFVLIIIFHLMELFSNKKLNIVNKKYDLKNTIYLFLFLFLIISFLIGERSNFIKVLIMILLFTFLFEKKFIKLKIILFTSFFIIMFLIINNSPHYKNRFINQMIKPIITIDTFHLTNNQYVQHYSVALKVYDNNKIFGVGLKNYRIEVTKKNYKGLFSSTHPHQLHFEALAELGIFGYLFLITFFLYHFYKFIKNQKFNNNLNLSGLLFVFTSLLPLLPSGSFFTSNGAAFFWMNFALMNLNQKTKL